MLGKDGDMRGEGNAWQRWRQEGRRERVGGRDCKEKDTGGTVGKGIWWVGMRRLVGD